MPSKEFTRGEADYLVSLPKFIREVPREQFLSPQRKTGWRIQVDVFYKSDPSRPINGLIVIAKAHQAPVGLPHPTPSAALEWHGKRIRGLNYELWHDNPDGSVVKGWHEHIWTPGGGRDSHVVQARPEPKDRSLRGILRWGLEKWNIEVQREQEGIHGRD